MDISVFKSKLGAGGARPNQFRVLLSFPNYVTGVDRSYSVLVTGAALPASNVNPAIIQYRGREVKLAGERIFDPFTITIVNDSDFSLRSPFERWMDGMNRRADNTATALRPSEYQVPLIVEHLDRNDQTLPNGVYTLENAFPIQMSEIALNYAQNDIFEEFTVTFQYSHYTIGGAGSRTINV